MRCGSRARWSAGILFCAHIWRCIGALSTGMLALLAVWHNHRVFTRGIHKGKSPLHLSGMTDAPTDWLVALGLPAGSRTGSASSRDGYDGAGCMTENCKVPMNLVLAICVVYRGCAIPVAWTILPAGKKRAWRREWLRMLRVLRACHPARLGRCLVLADRGLVRPLAVSADRAAALASLAADQPGLQISPGWSGAVRVAATRWSGRSGSAGAAREPPLPRAIAGWTVRWWRGGADGHEQAVVRADRSGARCVRCAVVCLAWLVRAGVQMHQARRLAMATDPDGRSGTGGAAAGWRWRSQRCG